MINYSIQFHQMKTLLVFIIQVIVLSCIELKPHYCCKNNFPIHTSNFCTIKQNLQKDESEFISLCVCAAD